MKTLEAFSSFFTVFLESVTLFKIGKLGLKLFCLLFETGSPCVTLTVLEFTVHTRLAPNSEKLY